MVLPESTDKTKRLQDRVRLLFVGRLSKVKGVDKILRAVASMENTQLTVEGNGEEKENLLALTQELQLQNRVHFTGAVDSAAVSALMKRNDILVMNSTVEGKPMTIVEALSHGLPVVATPEGGIPEMVTDGQKAIFTDGTEQKMTNVVHSIESHYQKYSAESLMRGENFDYRHVNEYIYRKLSEFYN